MYDNVKVFCHTVFGMLVLHFDCRLKLVQVWYWGNAHAQNKQKQHIGSSEQLFKSARQRQTRCQVLNNVGDKITIHYNVCVNVCENVCENVCGNVLRMCLIVLCKYRVFKEQTLSNFQRVRVQGTDDKNTRTVCLSNTNQVFVFK